MTYKAIMLNDVPNFVFGIGYTNASWTLKIDLTYDYVWKLIKHMDATGTTWCAPRLNDPSITPSPMLDFSSGYVTRSIDQFPRAGSTQAVVAADELHRRSPRAQPRLSRRRHDGVRAR